MATFSTGAYHGTRYIKELEFGVTPANPQMKSLRHTSNSLILTKDSFQSEELRTDAQIFDLRHGNRRNSGDIGIEFSYGEFDDFLQAAIRSPGWLNVSGDNTRQYIVAGVVQDTFTIERVFADIQEYQVFTGCGVNTFSLTIEPNAMVTGTIGIVGKDVTFNSEPLDDSPTASNVAPAYDGFSGTLLESGAQIAVVTSVELSIENNMDPAFVIGSDSAITLNPGRINITGTLSAFFENTDLLARFANETEASLQFTLGDANRQSYTFTLPRIKYSGGDNPVDGEGPITLSMPFQALLDTCTGTNIRIERFAGQAAQACAVSWQITSIPLSSGQPSAVPVATVVGGAKAKKFNGFEGQNIPGVTFTNVPAGLTARVVKKSDTTAELRFTGTATASSPANMTVAFTAASFMFGFCNCNNSTITGLSQSFSFTSS